MQNLEKLGKISSGSEVSTVTPFGVWVLASGREYYLDHKNYPWFREASVEHVMAVESPAPNHLRWPALDIDLHVESLEHPEHYPLIAKPRKRASRRKK